MSFKMFHIIHIFRSYSSKTPGEQPCTNNYPKKSQSPAKPDASLDLLHGVIKKKKHSIVYIIFVAMLFFDEKFSSMLVPY